MKHMEKSALVKDVLGAHIFNKFLDGKREEWNSYRTQVTKWELDSYLTKY
ncbi:MAG TPA: hypothetical protein PLH18_03400 [Clostridia bacterium]|nr:hypothetical protein [Clostridia bacterium]